MFIYIYIYISNMDACIDQIVNCGVKIWRSGEENDKKEWR